ncbi:HAD family hydrolase [Streptomyces dioscori]|uniref:HAD family hydrolase n=1 Tax=Streptomyces dioscori TaxID=2109333 RepID=A0A2P8QDP9_9ACTN|nr:HAD-IA family hydrolase [Streptomyces dioscori]PSM44395.1 HAD family hydrolase [Streptomyces dioscori]
MAADIEGLVEDTGARAARRLLADARCVLFDFDGPICRLFPEGRSRPVADRLRRKTEEFGAGDVLTPQERDTKDPHVVLRAVHRAGRNRSLPGLLSTLEALVEAGEVEAARTAWPTPDADTLLDLLSWRRTRLAVVTNNSPLAAEAYLGQEGLLHHFAVIEGRTADPGRMKPDPDVVFRALQGLKLRPEDAVMIGDTSTDVEAAGRAGVGFIGYGRNPEKRGRLRAAGAEAVLGSYAPLLQREAAGRGVGAVLGLRTGSVQGEGASPETA